jgi:hypothetical protein
MSNDHDTRRNPEMEKYVQITPAPTEDEPEAQTVWLKFGVQSFRINDSCENLEHAEWMRDMLCIALAKIVADAKETKP